jgi:hypothetical protein
MANTVNGLLTTQGKTALVSFVGPLTNGNALASAELYGFIGRPSAWDNGDTSVPPATEEQTTLKTLFKNVIAYKAIQFATVSPVVPRFDWSADTVFVEYSDTLDMFDFDTNGIQVNPFYVRNSYDQIFKCLSNNNGNPSTVEPAITPGSTTTEQILYLADGYKWAYITTIDKGLKKTFFDAQWMPVALSGTIPNTLTAAGFGQVDVVNVSDGGSGYIPGISTTTVTIGGDGYGATAYANVDTNGVVTDVIVTDPGTNYTYATASLVPTNSLNPYTPATANAIVSPIGGTGYDPVSELGCNHLMFTFEFDNDEHEEIDASLTGQVPLPTDISFRQLGIIVNPLTSAGETATGIVYNAGDTLLTATGVGSFITDPSEVVYQGDSASPNWMGLITKHDNQNNIVQVINTSGIFISGKNIIGLTSQTQRVVLQYTPTIVSIGSGYVLYYENRNAISRSATGNEQLRLVLKF